MPVAAGIMQFCGINITPTECYISNITPSQDNVVNGDSITFEVTVDPIPAVFSITGGTFSIVNTYTDTVIATGSISSGVGTSAPIAGLAGILMLKASYSGIPESLKPSASEITPYVIPR